MSTIYIRVKIKTLAAEARIIRLEERRAKARWKHLRQRAGVTDDDEVAQAAVDSEVLFFGLKNHRRGPVRSAAREAQLVYGFLRGTPYLALERTCRTEPDWREIGKLIKRYGHPKTTDQLQEWCEAA
jgi:hypothetical protein